MTRPFDAAAHADAMAASLGLAIDPAWRPAVVEHLAAIARAAELVLTFEPAAESEPAPVYEPER